jgi:hypothetical protein
VLREIQGVRQDRPEVRRRWFQDDYLDLFVWTEGGGGRMLAFQLAYDRTGDEHLLEWECTRGYLHRRVSDGDRHITGMAMTPLLGIAGRFPKYRVLTEFERRSSGLEPALREAVRRRLVAYNNPRRRRPTFRKPRAHRL